MDIQLWEPTMSDAHWSLTVVWLALVAVLMAAPLIIVQPLPQKHDQNVLITPAAAAALPFGFRHGHAAPAQ